MKILALAVVLSLAALPARADDPAMHAAAEGFYGVYRTFHPSDGIPEAKGRARYAPFLSPRLEALLEQAGAAEAAFAAKHKDSPPMIEGDLFSSLFEGATSVAVGACAGDAQKGQCAVDLGYAEPGRKPTQWADTVYLVNTPSGWRVDDIGYGGSWAFGNKGRLSETLGQVIHFQ